MSDTHPTPEELARQVMAGECACDCAATAPFTWEVSSGSAGGPPSPCTAPPESLEVTVDGLALDLKPVHKDRLLRHFARAGNFNDLPPDLVAVLRRAVDAAGKKA